MAAVPDAGPVEEGPVADGAVPADGLVLARVPVDDAVVLEVRGYKPDFIAAFEETMDKTKKKKEEKKALENFIED